MTGSKVVTIDAQEVERARQLSIQAAEFYTVDDFKAIDCYSQALSIYRNVRGEEHADVARTLTNLGTIYDHCGDKKQAIEFYNKAFATYRKALRKPDLEVAFTLTNLGRVYSTSLRNYPQAIKSYRQALIIYRQIMGAEAEHVDIAKILNSLGFAYSSLDDYNNAIRCYERAEIMYRNLVGEESAEVGISLSGLGMGYFGRGDYQRAVEFFHRALIVECQVWGEENESVAETLDKLATSYSALDENQKAIEFYERSLSIALRLYGEEHSLVAKIRYNLGAVYSIDDEKKANDWYNLALEICRKVWKDDDYEVAVMFDYLGVLNRESGHFEIAVECFNKSLVTKRKLLGDDHIEFAKTLYDLGLVSSSLNDQVTSFHEPSADCACLLRNKPSIFTKTPS